MVLCTVEVPAKWHLEHLYLLQAANYYYMKANCQLLWPTNYIWLDKFVYSSSNQKYLIVLQKDKGVGIWYINTWKCLFWHMPTDNYNEQTQD